MTEEGPLMRWTKISEGDLPLIGWERGDFLIDVIECPNRDGLLISVLKKSDNNGYDLLHDGYQTQVLTKKQVQPVIKGFAHRINVEKFDRPPHKSYSIKGEQTKLSDHIEA